MSRLAIAFLASFTTISVASAATIYEPVQYQHGSSPTYFYGGENPQVHRNIQRFYGFAQNTPAARARDFIVREDRSPIVYSNIAPHTNLAIYGYTADDARNEAYANVPRYFRKRELLRAATLDADGNRIVTAQAVPEPAPRILESDAATRPATRPILIIPRRLLEKKAIPESRMVLAK